MTGKEALGLVGSMAVGIFNCIKMALGADEMGFDKAGCYVWSLVQAVIGLLAYMNAMA